MATIALNTAATGMKARETEIAIIANNISNMSTTAFQGKRAEFQDLLYQIETRPGATSSDNGNIIPTGIQIGLGTKLSGTYNILDFGGLTETKGKLDLAIGGTAKGYFRIEMPDGTFAYTKAGSFRMGPNAEILTDEGYVVSPGLIIPANTTNITINNNGQVLASIAGSGNAPPQLVGQFDIVDFSNPSGLLSEGKNLLTETAASGTPILGVAGVSGMGEILQGWLESSNVNPIHELTNMITAQRGYELCSSIIKATDEMMQTANRSKA